MMTEQQQQDELLSAFKYFNNEMSETESDEFEELLANDLALQSCLTDVVLIQSALTTQKPTHHQTLSKPVSHRPVRQTRTAALVGGALALTVLLSVLILKLPQSSNESSNLLAIVDAPLRQTDLDTLRVWTRLESDSNVAASRRQVPAEYEDHAFSNQSNDELDIPDWMFAAVEASTLEEEVPALDLETQGGTL